jgi:hypothetical protein
LQAPIALLIKDFTGGSNHLAERGVLAAYLVDIGETEVRKPRDGRGT